jgi:TctA family transporter
MRRGIPGRLAAAIMLSALALLGCKREQRRFNDVDRPRGADNGITMSELQPGPAVIHTASQNSYYENSYAVS